ncbi:MAG: c-type cytochrome [Gemmatimonadetes bacterium]|nr:c-type cytochrome [Gemmatimonadota bacterium]
MRIRLLGSALVVFCVSACGGGPDAPKASATADTLHLSAPSLASLADDSVGRSVRRGLALLTHTRDSLPGNVRANLRCVSCHLDEGRRAFAMPWVGVYGRFPQYRSRAGRVARIEDRINDCIQRSLNGTALPTDGDDMRDIVMYLSWLSRGTASGVRLRGTGIDSLVPIAADTGRGRVAYTQHCARCHAPDGGGLLGQPVENPGPPLWGDRSFNIGSGMARVRVMAAFAKRQMPFDAPGRLTSQEAFDVAAFIGARPRPDFAPKQFDWPNGDPPSDVAYPTVAAARRAPRP